MKFQYIIFILGLFLFSYPGNAMDDEYEFGKVIVKIWKPTTKIPHGHIALKTDDYISLWPESNTPEGSFPRVLAYGQVQDERELGEPNEMYSLRLKIGPMNAP